MINNYPQSSYAINEPTKPRGMSFGEAQMARYDLAKQLVDAETKPLGTPLIAATRASAPPVPAAIDTTPANTAPVTGNMGASFSDMSDTQWDAFALARNKYAAGGAVAAPSMDMTHPLYTKYLAAMHRAGMMNRVQPPEMIIPKMAQYDAQNRMALAQQTVNGGTQGFAQGGMVDTGGQQVLGPGTGKSDSIPAMIDGKHPAALSNGEFHFPKQAVDFYGTKVLDAMVAKARQALKLKG